MYSGEYDVCDVTLSVYPHRASLKNMPGHGGNRNYDLWNTRVGHFVIFLCEDIATMLSLVSFAALRLAEFPEILLGYPLSTIHNSYILTNLTC